MASSSSGPPSSVAAGTAPARSSAELASYFANSSGSTSAPTEKPPDDSSKLRTFLSILRRFIGVTDIAAVRFSLPSQLLEPIPNLEYWHYLDRPETFISIADADDAFGRMLGTLRFWFTKDLKYVKGKPCKPYNSALGEFFRCNWDVDAAAVPSLHDANESTSAASSAMNATPIRISYLTEQTSHHPPVSAFFIDCPERGITARGYDQLSAKFTGTSIRVIPGAHNLGIFITLQKRGDEEYQLTHPAAQLAGLLRGSLSVTVADTCFVTCAKTQIKVILQYLEEGWLGKSQNKIEGLIFRYDPAHDHLTRLKDVPEKDILGRIGGSWMDKIYYTVGHEPFHKSPNKALLIDLGPLYPAPKQLPPGQYQLANESSRLWSSVTHAILSKQFSLATSLKQELEERQRQKVVDRKARGADWRPRFFTGALTPVGKPDLTDEGREALHKMHDGDYALAEREETAA